MEKQQIVKEFKEWQKAIKEKKSYILCSSCYKIKLMTNTSQITLRLCDDCMEGVKIPKF